MMDEILDDLEIKDRIDDLSDKEIFGEIFIRPRRVFKYIHANAYTKYMGAIIVLIGISDTLDRAASNGMGDNSSLLTIIAISVIFGGLFSWLSFYIYSGLLSWTGKWLKGTANTQGILRVLAYSSLPNVIGFCFFLMNIMIFGGEVFKSERLMNLGTNPASSFVFYGLVILQFILNIWSAVLAVIGLSEVQQFSIIKSILNFILPVLVISVPILLIALLIFGLS